MLLSQGESSVEVVKQLKGWKLRNLDLDYFSLLVRNIGSVYIYIYIYNDSVRHDKILTQEFKSSKSQAWWFDQS